MSLCEFVCFFICNSPHRHADGPDHGLEQEKGGEHVQYLVHKISEGNCHLCEEGPRCNLCESLNSFFFPQTQQNLQRERQILETLKGEMSANDGTVQQWVRDVQDWAEHGRCL